jgi:hypothetical protein
MVQGNCFAAETTDSMARRELDVEIVTGFGFDGGAAAFGQ